MTTKLTIAVLCSLLVAECISAQIMFQRTYGDTSLDIGYASERTMDGGYAIAGYFADKITLQIHAGLIKTDENGDTLWTRTYDGLTDDGARSMKQTGDSGYVMTGFASSPDHNIRLLKTGSQGELQWTRNYGGNTSAEGESVIQTADGGYLITADPDEVYLIKTDSNGDTLWTRIYGGTGPCRAYDVQQTSDGGYIVTGYTQSPVTYGDFYLLKLNASGDSLWTRTYGGNGSEEGHSVKQTIDGGFIITGESFASFGPASNNIYLIKTDNSGNAVWSWVYGGVENDRAFDVEQMPDKGFVIAGGTESYGAGDYDACLLRTDSNGILLWTKTYGGSGWDDARSVKLLSDSGFIVAGIYGSNVSGDAQVYLIKTDAEGNSGCNELPALMVTDSAETIVGYTGFHVSAGIDGISLSTTYGKPIPGDIRCHNSVFENESARAITIYPNPFTDEFTMDGTDAMELPICMKSTGGKFFARKLLHIQRPSPQKSYRLAFILSGMSKRIRLKR